MLGETFKLCNSQGRLTLVVLSACYAADQAEAIAGHVEWVVALAGAADSESGARAARTFTRALYQAIGAGKSVHEAFKRGDLQQRLEGQAPGFALYHKGEPIAGVPAKPLARARPSARQQPYIAAIDAPQLVIDLERRGESLHTAFKLPDGLTLGEAGPRRWRDIESAAARALAALGQGQILDQHQKIACGQALFDIAFGPRRHWQPVIRSVFRYREADSQPAPSYRPVHARICTGESLLLALPAATAASPALPCAWLHVWLHDRGDPVHNLHAITCARPMQAGDPYAALRHSRDAATLGVHARYALGAFHTGVPHDEAAPDPAFLLLDREDAKALTVDFVKELRRSDELAVLALIALGAPGNQIGDLHQQLAHKLKSEMRGIKPVVVSLPPPRRTRGRESDAKQYRLDIEHQITAQLARPGQSLEQALAQRAVRGVQDGPAILWLDWGKYDLATDRDIDPFVDRLDAWAWFACHRLTEMRLDGTRLVSFLAIETDHDDDLEHDIEELIVDNDHEAFLFRHLRVGKVASLHLFQYLQKDRTCPPTMHKELVDLILRDTGGLFAPTVTWLDRGHREGWRAVRNQLRDKFPDPGRRRRRWR